MKRIILSCWILTTILAVAAPAVAQEMPAPRRMPRTPVSSETLEEQRHNAAPTSRILQGPVAIIDGERLRIDETDVRLFGVVPPQLAASFGPQARSTLDGLANGQTVACQIRDRDRDGRLLATCHTSNGSDMALELLKRGLAVTARGSLAGSDVANLYLAAEAAAQNQKLGLWSVMPPPAATLNPGAAAVAQAVVQPQPVMPVPATAVTLPLMTIEKVVAEKVAPKTDKASGDALPQGPDASAKTTVDPRVTAHAEDERWQQNSSTNFFERYQVLIACFLMLATTLSIITAVWAQKRRDRSDETKAVAAALRGELMAARGVCLGRVKSITNDAEDRAAIWPRIRSTLYQAYVGRLGFLGAELARQVSSIYGQSSDYAALYSPTGAAHDTPKKGALETLVRHIDEILPKLAVIEQSGALPPSAAPRPRAHIEGTATRVPNPPVYKSISAPAEKKPTAVPPSSNRYFETLPKGPAGMPSAAPVPPAPIISPIALWEAVRAFIQNHRNAIINPPPQQPPHPSEAHVAEYAAMIEEDMARYPYTDGREPLDITPHKKSG